MPPLRLHRRRMLGLNPVLLRLWLWQSVALTTRLDLIHFISEIRPPLPPPPVTQLTNETEKVITRRIIGLKKSRILAGDR
jgi:hypothetical protein